MERENENSTRVWESASELWQETTQTDGYLSVDSIVLLLKEVTHSWRAYISMSLSITWTSIAAGSSHPTTASRAVPLP